MNVSMITIATPRERMLSFGRPRVPFRPAEERIAAASASTTRLMPLPSVG